MIYQAEIQWKWYSIITATRISSCTSTKSTGLCHVRIIHVLHVWFMNIDILYVTRFLKTLKAPYSFPKLDEWINYLFWLYDERYSNSNACNHNIKLYFNSWRNIDTMFWVALLHLLVVGFISFHAINFSEDQYHSLKQW